LFPKYNQKTDFGMFFATQVASGSLAGGVTNSIVYPLIYVRTVLGADLGKVKKYSGMGDCIAQTVKANGVLSLYNGIGASSIGIVVYRGTQFGLQDTIKAFNPYQKDFTVIGLVSKFCVAQVAVSVSGITAYPFDTIQRRLQIEASKPKADQIYNGMADCVAKIMAAEGPKGFFKGALANIVRGTGAAIVLVMYDEIQNFIARQ
jgi:solute carrier family 25 (adenine nucleotide translocator) protein 4/5/6/31